MCTGDNVLGPCRDPLGFLALLSFAMTMLSLRKTVETLSGEKYLPCKPEHLNSHLQNIHKVGQIVHTHLQAQHVYDKCEVKTVESPELHNPASIAHVIEKQWRPVSK